MTTEAAPVSATIEPPVHEFPVAAQEQPKPVVVNTVPKVFIALCTRDWQVEAHTSESVRAIGRLCNAEITVRYMMNDGVARARNNLAAMFLESDCDLLHFLDSDIIEEARHFARLVDFAFTQKKVIGALYPKK